MMIVASTLTKGRMMGTNRLPVGRMKPERMRAISISGPHRSS